MLLFAYCTPGFMSYAESVLHVSMGESVIKHEVIVEQTFMKKSEPNRAKWIFDFLNQRFVNFSEGKD